MGHPFRFTRIAHADRTILGPFEPDELEAVLDTLPLPAGGHAVDVGCGKGDLLIRLARRGLTGEGLDRNAGFLADAEAHAQAAGVAPRLRWTETPDAVLGVPPAGDVVACVGATGALGGPQVAPALLRRAVRPGGLVLVGEGFWARPPEPAWLAEFGMEPLESVDLDATVARIASAGFEPLSTTVASVAGWDAYESAYAGAVERWATANPVDPDRDEFLARAAFMRDTYARWRRDAMGFVLVAARTSGTVSG